MNWILALLSVLIIVNTLIFIFFLRNRRSEKESDSMRIMTDWMKQIKEGTDQTRQEMQKSIGTTNREINERLDNAARVIGTVSKELGQMQQIGQSLSYVQDFLLSAKKRGGMGEQIMEETLKQSMPPTMYHLQYRFKTGECADCVIKVSDRLIAVDSKFSMENYRAYIKAESDEQRDAIRKLFVRDVKKRIDEISRKYILPEEGTMEFAMMYVPAEGVFNEVANDLEILEYARGKNVQIVSPSTFYYSLKVILLAMQGTKVNEQAAHILKTIQGMRKDSEKFGDNLSVLTKHITNAKSTLELVGSGYERIQNKINEVSDLKIETPQEKALLP